MNEVIVNNINFKAANSYPIDIEPSLFGKRFTINGEQRDTIRMTLIATYADVAANFINGAVFSIRQYDIDENGKQLDTYVDYIKNDYVVAGDIVDHRNGMITVYMAQKTSNEIMTESLESENAALLYENLTGGKFVV